ncbi:D-TA family PLP-dependent enzyme [Kriegella aquimaris]|uniref:D-serine deaminase, pyridoxal phosphate-dependent n=1 Tax=Kriegella aquimaris TaxID=192904 RepID=A0A1G9M7T3_9FLAO|nr:D-TA family PLP-dependent enzyme [Kriegella aquimaris]SDL70163.1 D-serine deaminase, pyridoxal phosphate-dependent [Kriegella aquimaris]
MDNQNWYKIEETRAIISPALLVYPDRISKNIRTMISIAGGTQNLRPHIKTHKMGEVIKMQLQQGIDKFKCATIAEAELLAQCGASDVLFAMQPVGANIDRFFKLMEKYPSTHFSALVDNSLVVNTLGEIAGAKDHKVRIWLDINNGMDRTGIRPGPEAVSLYESIGVHPYLKAEGLHVYDGHIRSSNLDERTKICDQAFEAVSELRNTLIAKGTTAPKIVAGGSPTFSIHAKRENVETSPGTTLLWDAGYGNLFPDLPFLPAAVLLTRVISLPKENTMCLDLGHKSIAPEMAFPRVKILDIEDSEQIGQSEEHLVVEHNKPGQHNVGDVHYAIPMHICPTVAKYENVLVVSAGKIVDKWHVDARNQKITI